MQLALLVTLLLGLSWTKSVEEYNVIWNTPSGSVEDMMPLGNGRMAVGIWPELQSNSIQLFVSRADARDENSELLKLTQLEVVTTPSVTWATFEQELDLDTATVEISLFGKLNGSPVAMHVSGWVDANSDNLVLDFKGSYSFSATVTLKPWRTSRQPEPSNLQGWMCQPRYIYPDTIKNSVGPNFPADSLVSYHRNIDSNYYTYSMTLQGLAKEALKFPNPLVGIQFGSVVYGSSQLKRTGPLTLHAASTTSLRIAIATHTNQTSEANWESQIKNQIYSNVEDPNIRPRHVAFWTSFWDRSYISITTSTTNNNENNDNEKISPTKPQADSDTYLVSRQYTIWRYLQACQTRTAFPLKFNGQLYVATTPNPDDRQWGGGEWWQNLRLPYYNMLASGDHDLILSLFDYYLNMLPIAQARTVTYFNITGAFWPETNVLFSLYYNSDYGCPGSRNGFPPSIPQTRWNRYNYQGGLDLSLLILEHFSHTKDVSTFKKYQEIIRSVIMFYSKRWTKTDSQGKLIFFPSQAIETYQCVTYPPIESDCVTNSMPDIAGLMSVLNALLELPTGLLDPQFVTLCKNLLAITPDLPVATDGSHLLAGQKLPPSQSNVENPELYAVHPYKLYTVAQSAQHNKPAITSYYARIHKCNQGWCQDIMNAALLGLTSEAQQQVVERAKTAPAQGYRFPGFMPHFQDFPPSGDHLSNLNSALQWMLLQSGQGKDQSIMLFPAWPCSWDVEFKLRAPENTVVHLIYKGGKVQKLDVTPTSRRNDIRFMNCGQ